MYFRTPLSLRLVEKMPLARGKIVSYETIRRSTLTFGPEYARRLRRTTPSSGDVWHLDAVMITIAGQKRWPWRAVDQEEMCWTRLFRPAATPSRPSACSSVR
jgi:putative transposase